MAATTNAATFIGKNFESKFHCEYYRSHLEMFDISEKLVSEQDEINNVVIGNDETELELSVESRSFVNRVNDQVRKRQKRMSNVAGTGEEHSIIWGMFMAATMNAATFMGMNFQDNQNSIMKSTDLTPEENVRHICKISHRAK